MEWLGRNQSSVHQKYAANLKLGFKRLWSEKYTKIWYQTDVRDSRRVSDQFETRTEWINCVFWEIYAKLLPAD
jgi:hypothetical protein